MRGSDVMSGNMLPNGATRSIQQGQYDERQSNWMTKAPHC